MLPSQKRLSRSQFGEFMTSRGVKSVFNPLGTLKYKDSTISQASVVISSKTEKRAVYRNKLRRRLYSIFGAHFKAGPQAKGFILHTAKQAASFEYKELKTLLNELLQKTTQ